MYLFIDITLQCCALGVMIIAFAMALKMVSVHFYSAHSKVGFTAICLSYVMTALSLMSEKDSRFISPVIGVISDRMYDSKREALPWWPDYAHCTARRVPMAVS